MIPLNACRLLGVLGLLGLLLTGAGCRSAPVESLQPGIPPADTGSADAQGMAALLPAPSTLRLASATDSAYLHPATDYEAGLPLRNIGAHEGRLAFIPLLDSPLAYCIYRLPAPPGAANPTVLLDPGFSPQHAWIGIANFATDRWNFGRAGELQYSPAHITDGSLLVAVVADSYSELEWLIAGGLTPPFVGSISPQVLSAGVANDFQVRFTDDAATGYAWSFGGGLSISASSAARPEFQVTTPGSYSGTLVATNAAGSCSYGFSYTVLAEQEHEPLHLYAEAETTSLQAGEELSVTIRTGLIPQPLATRSLRVALSYPASFDYVPDSFNTGDPGGGKWAFDGFWTLQPGQEAFFVTYPDDWLIEEHAPQAGMEYMQFSLAAAEAPLLFGSGVLCNLRLRCREAGTFSLGFLEAADYPLTSYDTAQGLMYWHDIGNAGEPEITVTP